MTGSEAYKLRRGRPAYAALASIAVVAAVVLRIVALKSDAYPGLSWSSALLTDEGFYIHNARNAVLFGNSNTDQFNNMLIMPTLHALQLVVFRIWGVGAIQARLISVILSLTTLPLFYLALFRSLGRRPAIIGTLLLSLDHVYLLYNRMALMDSPAAAVLILALYLWVDAFRTKGNRRTALLFVFGNVMVLAYTVRGLVAPLFVAPFIAIYISRWRNAKLQNQLRLEARGAFGNIIKAWPIAAGMATGAVIYLAAWYLPNRIEIARVNHYYIQQLLSDSITDLWHTFLISIFGVSRGLVPFLMRHSPVLFIASTAWIGTRVGELLRLARTRIIEGGAETSVEAMPSEETAIASISIQESRWLVTDLLAVWQIILFLILVLSNYSPSRYYVLAYPAMAALSGYVLSDLSEFLKAITRNRFVSITLTSLLCYHAVVIIAEHFPGATVGLIYRVGAMGAVIGVFIAQLAGHVCNRPTAAGERGRLVRQPAAAILAIWFAFNIGWTGHWITHLTYRQESADNWLAKNLPRNSVLFGAVAPGLCLENQLRVVNVLENLCNDDQPVEHFQGLPRYVLLLDDKWREAWWDKHYAIEVSPDRRIMKFEHILRPDFTIGVYSVDSTTHSETR